MTGIKKVAQVWRVLCTIGWNEPWKIYQITSKGTNREGDVSPLFSWLMKSSPLRYFIQLAPYAPKSQFDKSRLIKCKKILYCSCSRLAARSYFFWSPINLMKKFVKPIISKMKAEIYVKGGLQLTLSLFEVYLRAFSSLHFSVLPDFMLAGSMLFLRNLSYY